MAVAPLVGRSREAGEIAGLLEGLPERGGALVVRGKPGIGKSALLVQAGMVAAERGLLVMSAAGVQSEAKLPFAESVLRAVVVWESRVSASAASSALPVRAAASISSTNPQLKNVKPSAWKRSPSGLGSNSRRPPSTPGSGGWRRPMT